MGTQPMDRTHAPVRPLPHYIISLRPLPHLLHYYIISLRPLTPPTSLHHFLEAPPPCITCLLPHYVISFAHGKSHAVCDDFQPIIHACHVCVGVYQCGCHSFFFFQPAIVISTIQRVTTELEAVTAWTLVWLGTNVRSVQLATEEMLLTSVMVCELVSPMEEHIL